VKAGTNSFLDVARQSYNEFIGDAKELIEQLQGTFTPHSARQGMLNE